VPDYTGAEGYAEESGGRQMDDGGDQQGDEAKERASRTSTAVGFASAVDDSSLYILYHDY
jgi:hypothetical protein